MEFNFERDDITLNLSQAMQYIDREASNQAAKDPKFILFKQWLVDNGAQFEMVEFPAVFQNGLMGLAAKQEIPPNKCFISIPNKIVLSIAHIKANQDLKPFLQQNPQVFTSKHPDHEFLMLAAFLLQQHLLGQDSFWFPYIQIMNPSDLLSNWPAQDLKQFQDVEVKLAIDAYSQEIRDEWDQMQPLFQQNPQLFQGVTKELWYRMCNFACTRCFGWGLPCVMMVPLVDYLNHLPVDTTVGMFNLMKTKDSKTNYEVVGLTNLDPEMEFRVKGVKVEGTKSREVLIAEIRAKFLKEIYKNPLNIWEQGYESSDCLQDDDESSDGDEEEDAEEDGYGGESYDEEEEGVDEKIEREIEERGMTETEKQFLSTQSDFERKLLSSQPKPKKQNNFKWWFDSHGQDSFFTVSTERHSYKPEQQVFLSYGRRANKFLLLFYGFLIPDNRHDSVMIRINRKLQAKDKLQGINALVTALVLDEAAVVAEHAQSLLPDYDKTEASKHIMLKATKLDFTLMSYLRAHLLLTYDKTVSKVTEPTDRTFELIVLQTYKQLLDFVCAQKKIGLPQSVSIQDPYRRSLVDTWNQEQHKIMLHQYSMVQTIEKVIQHLEFGLGQDIAIAQVCLQSHPDMVNCLNMRKYLKQLVM